MKYANEELSSIYQMNCDRPSDINELLPILKKYAEKSLHITEMGVRSAVSTTAFLAALPNKLISYDIVPTENYGVSYEWLKNLANENGTEFNFILANVLDVEIEETDFLFIDTWHVYQQVKKELELHSSKVRKYIGFHDTTTFGFMGEDPTYQGLWPAIQEFLEENKNWVIEEKVEYCNGLTILKKLSD